MLFILKYNVAILISTLSQNFKRCLEEWYPPPFRFRPSAKVVHFSRNKMMIKVPTDLQGWKIMPDVQPCEVCMIIYWHQICLESGHLTSHDLFTKCLGS